jgi:ATP-dependent exoDNAse (exonuclease V) alpha subunit
MSGQPIKAGDQLAFRTHRHYEIKTVEKVTPKGFIKIGHLTLNPDLTIRGRGAWSTGPWRAEPVTQEILDSVETHKLAFKILKTSFPDLPLETLRKIDEAIKEAKAKVNPTTL